MKVVINKCYGGFSLSPAAIKRLAELQGRECYFFTNREPATGEYRFNKNFLVDVNDEKFINSLFFSVYDIPDPDNTKDADKHFITSTPEKRNDPLLIKVVEELGGGHRIGASGYCAELVIVEIPDGVDYYIDEYDGMESIHESHRSWG